MSWNQWYRATSYVKSALWVAPCVAMLFEQVAIRLLHFLDARLGWTLLGLGVAEAQAMLQAIITMTLSFIVFTFASLLVAVQIAGGQLTPRIIATTLLRDSVVKYSVGLFVFALLFAIGVQGRMDSKAHQLIVLVAALLGFACIAVFLYLIDYAARLLRPVRIVERVGQSGLAVIGSVFPDLIATSPAAEPVLPQFGTPDKVLLHRGSSEIVLAVNIAALLTQAVRSDCLIEFVPQAEISSPRMSRCSDCTAWPVRSTTTPCEAPLPSAPSARWSRIPRLRFGFWSILRSRRSQRRSTIQRPPFLSSISFTGCCAGWAAGSCATK